MGGIIVRCLTFDSFSLKGVRMLPRSLLYPLVGDGFLSRQVDPHHRVDYLELIWLYELRLRKYPFFFLEDFTQVYA